MRKNIFAVLAGLLVLVACKKEESSLEPSGADKNFLVIKDNPQDDIDHTIFEVFKSTGVPIFYNDTVASETRVSKTSGLSYTYYEYFSLNYALNGGLKTLVYHELPNRADVKFATVLLRDQVLPKIPKKVFIPSIFLLNDLSYSYVNSSVNYNVILDAYRGYNTLGVVAKDLSLKSPAELNIIKAKIISTAVFRTILNEKTEELEDRFFSLTSNIGGATPVYYVNFVVLVRAKPTFTTLKSFGFLDYHPGATAPNGNSGFTPSKDEDLMQYLVAIFSNTTAQFKDANATNAVVLKKFSELKEIVKEVGFVFAD